MKKKDMIRGGEGWVYVWLMRLAKNVLLIFITLEREKQLNVWLRIFEEHKLPIFFELEHENFFNKTEKSSQYQIVISRIIKSREIFNLDRAWSALVWFISRLDEYAER